MLINETLSLLNRQIRCAPRYVGLITQLRKFIRGASNKLEKDCNALQTEIARRHASRSGL